jgi:hypothetical protein
MNNGEVDINSCSVRNSDYKWLSDTLKTAQLGPGYRPYFTCKIVNDTITPNAILTQPNIPINGKSVQAPDGNILSVGADASNNLAFWNTPNMATGLGTKTILTSTYRNDLNASVSVSDWINGYYVIDVYAFFNNSGNLNVIHYRSVNSGASFSSSISPTDIVISNATTNNVYVAAGTPLLNIDGSTIGGSFFYIKAVSTGFSPPFISTFYQINYQTYSGTGSSFSSPITWNLDVDPEDWIMQSLDVIYYNGYHYIVFAGYHQYLETVPDANFGIYIMRTNAAALVSPLLSQYFWSIPTTIIESTANTTFNGNIFTYPRISAVNGSFTLLFKGDVIVGLKTGTQSNPLTTQHNYYMSTSVDLNFFSYPTPVYFTDGTIFFPGPNGTTYTKGYDFVQQGSYCYIVSAGLLWQYIVNNIVADITNSIINYDVDDTAGQASQITITLANANNQWYGPSPTRTGAAAIAQNMKIYLEQGYYNASGVGEVVPKSIFFISNITQNVTSNSNDVQIIGLDLNKKLTVLSTEFSFTSDGPGVYVDLFDGSTTNNWTVQAGSWSQQNNTYTITSPGGGDDIITLNNFINNTESSIISCVMNVPTPTTNLEPPARYTAIYLYYIDPTNFIRIKFEYKTNGHGGWTGTSGFYAFYEINLSGSLTSSNPALLSSQSTYGTFPFLIRKYNYVNFDLIIGNPSGPNGAYSVGCFDPTAYSGTFANYPVVISYPNNLLTGLSPYAFLNGVIGLGASNFTTSFSNFQFMRFNNSQSINDGVRRLAALAGVTKFNTINIFNDQIFLPSNYSGTPFSYYKGMMKIGPSSEVINTSYQISNGDLVFKAFAQPTNPAVNYGFEIFFQGNSSTPTKSYAMNIQYIASSGNSLISLGAILTDQTPNANTFTQTSLLGYSGGSATNSTPFDISRLNTYKIVSNKNTIMVFVNDRCMLMWNDSNSSEQAYLTSNGYWGFLTDANSTAYVSQISSELVWNQIAQFALNAGDDTTSTAQNVILTINGWYYADLMGRLNTIVINANDPSTYTYQNTLVGQNQNASDTGYVNQVTVQGSGVMAVVQNTQSIATTGYVRDLNVVDYTILTYADALVRANAELTLAQRFNVQNTPANPNNVGSEMFDVITIVNTGNNSTNVNGTSRVYNQTIKNDGSKGQYSINIETGNPS